MRPSKRPLTVFFSVGEPSGDLHGANLIRHLRAQAPGLRAVGYGGPRMQAAGCELHEDLTALAVMWFLRVLLNLHRFIALWRRADRYFRDHRPDAVVLIDYPGFNWWIASAAKQRGIPVFYYTPPQIWAWGSWRVKKMRRYVDHVLCSLPFEEAWFRQRGCRATYVGHPFFDEVREHPLDREFVARERSRPGPLVTLLPGSRTQEVESNLRCMLRAVRRVSERVPTARFALAAFKEPQAEYARRAVAAAGLEIPVYVGRTPELMAAATCCLAVSGSVSLELLYHRRPTVVLYQIGRLAYWVQAQFRRVKYITLVNLLAADELYPSDLRPYDPGQADAARVPFPEYLTWEDKSRELAEHLIEWLINPAAQADRVAQLDSLAERYGHPGSSRRAAEYVLATLAGESNGVAAPHFLHPAALPSPGERGASAACSRFPSGSSAPDGASAQPARDPE